MPPLTPSRTLALVALILVVLSFVVPNYPLVQLAVLLLALAYVIS